MDFTVMLLLLFLNWQKNLSATFFESHSYDNVKLYTIVDIHGLLETHIHFLMWIDICTNSDRNSFYPGKCGWVHTSTEQVGMVANLGPHTALCSKVYMLIIPTIAPG